MPVLAMLTNEWLIGWLAKHFKLGTRVVRCRRPTVPTKLARLITVYRIWQSYGSGVVDEPIVCLRAKHSGRSDRQMQKDSRCVCQGHFEQFSEITCGLFYDCDEICCAYNIFHLRCDTHIADIWGMELLQQFIFLLVCICYPTIHCMVWVYRKIPAGHSLNKLQFFYIFCRPITAGIRFTLTRDTDIGFLSVRLSVCYVVMLYINGMRISSNLFQFLAGLSL